MTRLILLGIAIIVVIMVARLLFPSASQKDEESGATEMVRDPNCDTYVPKQQAVRRTIGQEEHFFCSEKCADEFSQKNP